MAPLITVLTVTRRIEALDRCIDSIQEQTYDGPIVHRFVVDGNDEIVTHLTNRALSSRIPILWTFMSRGFGDTDGPARLAVLRNAAVKLAGSDYVAFLDDDNRWEPIHLQSLWSTIVAESVDIAHTERKLFHHDGSPYLIPEFPWCRDEVSRRAIYTFILTALRQESWSAARTSSTIVSRCGSPGSTSASGCFDEISCSQIRLRPDIVAGMEQQTHRS